MSTIQRLALAASFVLLVACGDSAEVRECTPEGACTCVDGTERDIACSCVGGSSCVIEGDDIEFQCEGNASCGMTCGDNCLVTCPGTTSCTVTVGEGGVVSCPGTASCDITCLGDCTVTVAGAASATVDCVNEAEGAICTVE